LGPQHTLWPAQLPIGACVTGTIKMLLNPTPYFSVSTDRQIRAQTGPNMVSKVRDLGLASYALTVITFKLSCGPASQLTRSSPWCVTWAVPVMPALGPSFRYPMVPQVISPRAPLGAFPGFPLGPTSGVSACVRRRPVLGSPLAPTTGVPPHYSLPTSPVTCQRPGTQLHDTPISAVCADVTGLSAEARPCGSAACAL
jgi:hypothetical protein